MAGPLSELKSAVDLARYTTNGWSVAYYSCAVVVAGLLVLVLTSRASGRQAPRRAFALNMSLVVLTLLSIGAAVAAGDRVQARAIARLGVAVAVFVGPSTLTFMSVMLGYKRQLREARVASWLAAAVLAVLAVSTTWFVEDAWRTPFGYAASAGFLLPLLMLVLFVSILGAFVVGIGRMRGTRDPMERRQLRTVLVAYGVGQLTVLDLIPMWGVAVIPSSYVWLTLSAVILTHGIRAHRLFDVADLGWRALAWVLASAMGLLVIVSALWLTAAWAVWRSPPATAALLFVLFLAVRAYLARVQPRIDDFFLRRRRDLERELEGLSDRLLVLHTAREIAEATHELLSRTLYVRQVAFAVREDGGAWRVEHSAWGSVPPPADDDALVAELRARPELAQRQAVPAPAERLFQRYGAEVILPLATTELIGILAVGPRPDARPFLPLELEFLARLRAAVAGPLAAARLYDRRHRLHQELEEKVAARSADLERALGNLTSAQSQLVQTEKMATLGLVVAGVAAELEKAVAEVGEKVPRLQERALACDEQAGAHVEGIPPGPEGDELRTWARRAKLEFVRRDVRPLVAAVAEGARRARGIAGDLSRFARSDEAALEQVDLHRELDSALNLLTHDLKDRVEVVREFDAALPVVECDRGPIGQVFMNLIINAAQAIEDKGRIQLRTRVLDGGERVEVSVADNGKGISPEHLSRIFEPFFTTKSLGQKGGTGLGLSISYGIIERHGGQISVDSAPGKGTEFRVQLPVKPRRLSRPMQRV